MDNTFKYALYTSIDKVRAFNYLIHDKDYDFISNADTNAYNAYTATDQTVSFMVLRANMKKVQNICCNDLLPYMNNVLDLAGYKFGYYIFNPTIISNSTNPFKKSVAQKLLPYIFDDMDAMPNMWIYFDSFKDRDLEQFIKLKYKDYIFEQGTRLYVKLLPQEDFSFIHEFMDDIFYYC